MGQWPQEAARKLPALLLLLLPAEGGQGVTSREEMALRLGVGAGQVMAGKLICPCLPHNSYRFRHTRAYPMREGGWMERVVGEERRGGEVERGGVRGGGRPRQ